VYAIGCLSLLVNLLGRLMMISFISMVTRGQLVHSHNNKA
jgi:hypothetical protein